MATLPDWGFCGPTYAAQSTLFDPERCINLYPEPGFRNSKSPMALIGTPGLINFMTLPTSPVRGFWAGNNRLFVCAGTHVYEVSSTGAVITDYGAMAGSAGGITPVTFAQNGNQLLVMDPSTAGGGGGIGGTIYLVNPVGPAMTQVFQGGALVYLDTFFVALSSTSNNQLNISAPLDGTTWPALDFVVRSGASDLCTQLAVLNGQLWIFGPKTIEVWYNAGNPLFPFARIQGATLNIGCLAPQSVVRFNNTILWLGSDENGYGVVYQANGLSPSRISNYAIEAKIAALGGPSSLSISFSTAFAYQEAGHVFYCLKIVTAPSDLQSIYWVYDLTTGLWHERFSSSDGINQGRWIPNCATSLPSFAVSNHNFVGDFNSGKIYNMNLSATSEAGLSIIRQRISPPVSNDNRRMTHNSLSIDADIGTASMVLDYSNDGGNTFLGRNRTIPKVGIAAAAGMDYYKIWQLGQARDRIYKLTITDSANKINIINAYLDATAGLEP